MIIYSKTKWYISSLFIDRTEQRWVECFMEKGVHV